MTSSASRYDYQFDPQGPTTPAQVCRLVGHDREVLELGCAGGAMSAVLNDHYGCQVTGIEFEAAAAEQARRYCKRVIQANLDDPTWVEGLRTERFDTVLAADVLEHLRDPLRCLRQIRERLADDGHLVVSVPNIANSGVLAALLANDFPYRETGLLDRTHIHFFTALTLGRMLGQAGFAVDHVETQDAGAWHPEFNRYWDALPEAMRAWLEQNPAGKPYQVIMRARPSANPPEFANPWQEATDEWLAGFPISAPSVEVASEPEPAPMPTVEPLADRAEKDAELAAAQAEAAALHRELAAITSSKSWKLTEPLRRLAAQFKSGK